MKGFIKTKKGSYGFINGNNNREYFFPFSKLEKNESEYHVGDKVKFEIEENSKPGQKDIALQIKKIEIKDEITGFLKENVLDLQDEDYDDFCDTTEEYARRLKKGKLKTSMLRKIYSRIMNTERPAELKMLRPQFAYTAGRNEEKGVRDLMNLLDHLVKKMENDNKEQLDNFKKFMEAVVAYRKYVGGDK
ncbi:MAG: type III-A CRISPR-associated protein Csm2 [bacterium]